MKSKKQQDNQYFFCCTFLYDDCDIIEYKTSRKFSNDKCARAFAVFFSMNYWQDKFGDILSIQVFRDTIEDENLIELIFY